MSALPSERNRTQSSMWFAALAIAALYVGSTILTPLYPIYRDEFGFSELVVTEIYAVYVVGNLLVLLTLGRLSDQIGRRYATLIALVIMIIATLCLLVATATAWLFCSRVLSGFAAGLGAGAVTAWITELEPNGNKARAAVVASAFNLSGLAFGALLAGLLAEYAPWPLRLSYVVYAVLLALMFVLVWRAPETVIDPVRNLAGLSLRPRIGIPKSIRLAFVAPAAMAFAAFALGGFYAAIVPGLLTQTLHQHNLAVVGGVTAMFFGMATLTAAVTGKISGRAALLLALVFLLTGLALLMAAEALHSMSALTVATLITGAAMALGYRGSLQIINQIAPEEHRAEVVSSYLLVCYCANSLPVIGVGLLSLYIDSSDAHRTFAIVLAVLATIACLVGLRYTPRK